MSEHQGHDALRLQDPAALGKDGRHSLLVVPSCERPGALLALEPGRIGDGFVVLVGQVSAEQLGEDMAGGALEPDIEEVRQLGVHDVVVIGRVHDHRVDAAVCDVVEAVARLAGDGHRWRREFRRVGIVEQATSVAFRFGANQRDEFPDAFSGLVDGPVIAQSHDERGHFGVGPLE